VTRVLLEGGSQLATAFLQARLVDRLVWFRAPGLIGGDGLPAIGDLALDRLTDMQRFQLSSAQRLDGDYLETYRYLA